ncbi:hypothetical protein BLA6993_01412 [Burkholderia lata]|uniref:hypothetical protein n=1 Tax=Burkholderia lata (strain ATCC 17760 / DSM 23089 / LMG 22485 / NCIMB 9086 / R18194 / 383) TaxID=482957 RepID=UPI001452CC64|nr:hypothetical protein [Burkholderia lata]VWB32652.1 hypothetical protein BLA6993_01412 [Burkholderia lata]
MRYGLLLPSVLLSGCSVFSPPPPTVNLEDVLSRVKIELGMYEQYEVKHANDAPLHNACRGYVNFHVTSAQVTLSVVHTSKTEVDPKLTLPVPLPATLSVSATGSLTRKGTQTLALNVYPAADTGITPLSPTTDTPLADALIGLREAMLKESARKPCVYLRQDNNAVKNTLSYAMEIDTSVGEGVNFGYTIFGLTGSHSDETDRTNKIEITFEPYLDPDITPKAPVAPPGKGRGEFSLPFQLPNPLPIDLPGSAPGTTQ